MAGLRRVSAAARLLGLRVRNPPEAWMSLCCVVCCQIEVSASSWSLFQRSPTTKCTRVWVWSWTLANAEILIDWGLLRHEGEYIYISYRNCLSWVKSAPFCIVWLPRNKICSWISALTADTQYFEIHFSVTWSVIVLYALIMISGLSYISTVGIGSFPEGKPAGAWRWPPTSI